MLLHGKYCEKIIKLYKKYRTAKIQDNQILTSSSMKELLKGLDVIKVLVCSLVKPTGTKLKGEVHSKTKI